VRKLRAGDVARRLHLSGQLADDGAKPLRIEHIGPPVVFAKSSRDRRLSFDQVVGRESCDSRSISGT
jgi:hypothetical protein